MHGRLKIRTTEEQQLIKQKEQQERLTAYRHGMKVILASRSNQLFNKESLAISASILEKNPDVYTLWNIRKEINLQQVENLKVYTDKLKLLASSEEGKVISTAFLEVGTSLKEAFNCELIESVAESYKDIVHSTLTELLSDKNKHLVSGCRGILEDIQKSLSNLQKDVEVNVFFDYELLLKLVNWNLERQLQKELDMTGRCLLVNPKSYAAWHHRFWILHHLPITNWENELQLVEKYLKYDDRNFHTWDYRRQLLQKLGYDQVTELQFSTDRINTNFSNYSSWHYRSTLRELNSESLEEELRLVQNAIFTDPYDSSTWFYLRWVLSNKAVTENHRDALFSDFEQLLELEPNCKWIYMAKCWIAGSQSLSNKEEIKKNVDVYRKLMELDPMRRGMYADYIKLAEEND